MAEMMSEEITKVMDEQRELEIEYARLVQQRDQLKGISNKQKLLETKEGIMVSPCLHKIYFEFHFETDTLIIESCERTKGLHDKALSTVTEEA